MVEGPPGADSEEKREPVSDIDIAVADSLNALDLKRPIREADIPGPPLRAISRCSAVLFFKSGLSSESGNNVAHRASSNSAFVLAQLRGDRAA